MIADSCQHMRRACGMPAPPPLRCSVAALVLLLASAQHTSAARVLMHPFPCNQSAGSLAGIAVLILRAALVPTGSVQAGLAPRWPSRGILPICKAHTQHIAH